VCGSAPLLGCRPIRVGFCVYICSHHLYAIQSRVPFSYMVAGLGLSSPPSRWPCSHATVPWASLTPTAAPLPPRQPRQEQAPSLPMALLPPWRSSSPPCSPAVSRPAISRGPGHKHCRDQRVSGHSRRHHGQGSGRRRRGLRHCRRHGRRSDRRLPLRRDLLCRPATPPHRRGRCRSAHRSRDLLHQSARPPLPSPRLYRQPLCAQAQRTPLPPPP
jgi:hypothetical protein